MTDFIVCKNCLYFVAKEGTTIGTKEGHGECRYNPPVVISTNSPRDYFPVISEDDWCGKFEERTRPVQKGLGIKPW